MFTLEPIIERLLKSALFKATKADPCNRHPCLTQLYSDGTGRLIASNGRVLVAVRNGCDWPLGLYKPPLGSDSREWLRDEAMEAEMAGKLQGRVYPDWEAVVVPTGDHDLYTAQGWDYVTQTRAVQAACVQSGVNVDWCQWGRMLEALMGVKHDSTSIECFGPERAVVVKITQTRLDVLAIIMPFQADLEKTCVK